MMSLDRLIQNEVDLRIKQYVATAVTKSGVSIEEHVKTVLDKLNIDEMVERLIQQTVAAQVQERLQRLLGYGSQERMLQDALTKYVSDTVMPKLLRLLKEG